MAFTVFVLNDNDLGLRQVQRARTGAIETDVTANATFKDEDGNPIAGLTALELEYWSDTGEFAVVAQGEDITSDLAATVGTVDIEGTGAWASVLTILNAPVAFKERRS